ncbi:MAG: hypothetical protein WC758_05670 [Candidatus Woesearchaeota archaeon]|jgi:hypothetical protein
MDYDERTQIKSFEDKSLTQERYARKLIDLLNKSESDWSVLNSDILGSMFLIPKFDMMFLRFFGLNETGVYLGMDLKDSPALFLDGFLNNEEPSTISKKQWIMQEQLREIGYVKDSKSKYALFKKPVNFLEEIPSALKDLEKILYDVPAWYVPAKQEIRE